MREFDKVAVLGFGTMGAGIAQVVAQSGIDVAVLEADETRIEAGRQALEAFLDGGVRRGKVTDEQRAEVLGRVHPTTSVSVLAGIPLVIEAVTEVREIKKALLADVASVVGEDAVLATNTSALSVSDLAADLPRPERVAGLHFFNPAPLMKVVEVVRALQTDPAVVDRLSRFGESLGKDAIVVKDRPGFLINRLLMPYLNDVVQAYDDELATAEDIDVALKLGLGYKQGPLELLDLIGLDNHEHATRSAYEATLDPAFAPPSSAAAEVAAGMHGNKTGKGFRTQESR
jgi:3-hydroxybutyryl-CoA dehydrogenase